MRITKLIFALPLCLAVTAGAQTTSSTTRSLSLAECIQIALEHNLDVKIERINPEIARYNLSLAYAGYDPNFSIAGEHDFSLAGGGIDQATKLALPASTSDANFFRSGLSGLLPSGLTYNMSGNITESYGSIGAALFDNTRGSVSISLAQPLLKNAWIDASRLNIQVNKKRLKISELQFQLQIMNTVTSVELAYYDLIQAEENVKVQAKALQLAEQLLSENKIRVQVGTLAPLDEKQAASQVAARRADVLAAQRTLASQQNALKSLLSDDFSTWQSLALRPAESLLAVPQVFDLQESWRKGIALRPDLLQSRVDLERQGIVLKYQFNQLFPELDLIGSYGHSANGALVQEFSDGFSNIRQGNRPFYSYGASLSIPLGNRSARNNYKIGKADQQQLLLRLKKLEQDVLVQIDDAVKLAQSNFDRVDATKTAREFAEAALEAVQKKLENGKSTSFEVLSLQRDLTAAQSAEVQALADYNRALAQLALREGTTLEKKGVKIELK